MAKDQAQVADVAVDVVMDEVAAGDMAEVVEEISMDTKVIRKVSSSSSKIHGAVTTVDGEEATTIPVKHTLLVCEMH